MSFWDTIKPTPKVPKPTSVDLSADARTLTLAWDDGVTTQVTARSLRQHCPCASCVDEWTRQRTLDIEKVPQDLKVMAVHPVGNYALNFLFGDGHSTGIFNWAYLRERSTASAT